MSLPVPRDPDQHCELCTIVWDALDTILTTLGPNHEDQPHLLASICAWWVANALELSHDDVHQLIQTFTDCLHTQGFIVPPPRPRRTRPTHTRQIH
jgi:hypothetical protein